MVKESTERILRIISMCAIAPGWSMMLAAGIKTSHSWYGPDSGRIPAFLSTIPFFWTLIVGIGFLFLRSKISPRIFILSDLTLAGFYFGLLLPIWIQETHRLQQQGDFLMLETYGSCFMILNMALHAFLFIHNFGFSWRRCEHCGSRMFHRTPVQLPPSPSCEQRGAPRYSLLGERQSYDAGEDETAALIPGREEEGEAAGPSEPKSADHQV